MKFQKIQTNSNVAWTWGSGMWGVMVPFGILVMLLVIKVYSHVHVYQFVHLIQVLLVVCQLYFIKNGKKKGRTFISEFKVQGLLAGWGAESCLVRFASDIALFGHKEEKD